MPAICEKCLKTIDSNIETRDDGVWLVKECQEHGKSEHLIEPNVEFYKMTMVQESDPIKREVWAESFSATGLDVTRRCNVKCPHCYVEPDNRAKDIAIDDLVEQSKLVKKSRTIILMGAEPTVRKDLPQLISAIKEATGKKVGIYTNAIRCADPDYAKTLKDSGLGYACVSLHTAKYLGDPEFFQKKVRGLTNLHNAGVNLHHISFSLESIFDLNNVLAMAIELKSFAGHMRIRSPQKIGICNDEPMYLSELYTHTVALLEATGHTVKILSSDNTPYHINLLVDDSQILRLIRWPTLASANIADLDCPPYALFDVEAGEVNLVLSFLLQEAKRNMAGARNLLSTH